LEKEMDKSYESKCHSIEEAYWWFEGRRDILYRLIGMTLDKTSQILEVGCSGGALLMALKERGYENVAGIDISKEAIELCRKRDVKNASVMDGARLEFRDGDFDAVIVSDVLEHIRDEGTALSEWNRVLRPGGKLIVFVPAFKFLWSEHDEVNNHYRRYSRRDLIRALERSGFGVAKSSYWNIAMFFPASLVRLSKRLFFRNAGKKDHFYRVNPLVNWFLAALLRLENSLILRLDVPFGVSVFCIGYKKGGQ
jgi:ubiquinone/menaquinone biosynthesis C-methylase UbiE